MVARGNVTRVGAGLTDVTCGRGFDPVTYSSPLGRVNRRSGSPAEKIREERESSVQARESLSLKRPPPFFFFTPAHLGDWRICFSLTGVINRSRRRRRHRLRDGEAQWETPVVLLAALRRAVLGRGQQEGRPEGGQRHR